MSGFHICDSASTSLRWDVFVQLVLKGWWLNVYRNILLGKEDDQGFLEYETQRQHLVRIASPSPHRLGMFLGNKTSWERANTSTSMTLGQSQKGGAQSNWVNIGRKHGEVAAGMLAMSATPKLQVSNGLRCNRSNSTSDVELRHLG